MKKIDFSLVTTCRNEIGSVATWKDNVLEQTLQPDEIVIVDAFSNDGTFEFLQEWSIEDSRVKVIQEKGAVAKGRNTAVRNSKYEYILSTDMGVKIDKKWCEYLIHPFLIDNTIEVVAGNYKVLLNNTPLAYAENFLFPHDRTLEYGFIPSNRSIAYLKRIWSQVGEYPEDLSFAGDDSVFGRQLIQENFNFAFASEAIVYWERPQTFKLLLKERFVYGFGDGEAFINTPMLFKLYFEYGLPKIFLAPLNFVLNFVRLYSLKAMFKALVEFKFKTFFLIPILSSGCAYHTVKGYILGYNKGINSCIDCRNRIHRNSKGYSVI